MSSELPVTATPRIQHNPPAGHGSNPVRIAGDISVLDGIKLIATSPFKDLKIHEFSLKALNVAASKFHEELTAPLQVTINSQRVKTITVLQSFHISLDPSDIHCSFKEIVAKQTAQEPFAQKLNFGKLCYI